MGPRIRPRLSLLWILRVAAVVVGVLHTAIAIQDQSMSEDGISYLDLGDAYLAGHWQPVNSVWSPAYPLILGTVRRLVRPSLDWEFTVVHLVNLGIYLLALVCFELFWRETRRALEAETASDGRECLFPAWAWWTFGYALFVWSSVVLSRFRSVTPDMLVAAIVYVAAALLVRVASAPTRPGTHALFGGVLGLGYLAKAVMFPIGLAFLGIAGLLVRWRERRWRHTVVGLAVFAVVAGPLVVALSLEKRRFTFGEVGRLTYLRYVDGMPYPHWPADAPVRFEPPTHPTRRIHDDPPVYEFRTPVRGTYPPSFDPSYWYDGVSAPFDLAGQARRMGVSAKFYFDLFIRDQGAMLGIVLVLLAMSRGRRRDTPGVVGLALLGTAAVALALYFPVYVEGRYLAPFIVILWAGLLSWVRVEGLPQGRSALRLAAAALPVLVLIQLAAFDWRLLPRFGPALAGTHDPSARATPRQLARAILDAGVRPGDEVGFIGYAFGATFARLARIRITSELPSGPAQRFWTAPRGRQDSVLAAFARSGAVAVVTDEMPPGPAPEGWTRIEGRRGYAYRLLRRGPSGPLGISDESPVPDR